MPEQHETIFPLTVVDYFDEPESDQQTRIDMLEAGLEKVNKRLRLIEPDGRCPEGCQSPLLQMGVI